MTAKLIAVLVGALGLGFTGTYFATNSHCSNGGCPIGNLINSMTSSSKVDCCNPAQECCDPPQACCGTAKAKSCCSAGASCCSPAKGCCEAEAISTNLEVVPACCYPGSPCCENGGSDCCRGAHAIK